MNIACVIDDGKIDCDDDEPPVKGGKLNIVKTITWWKEVKNTGDIIVWNIKVTAEDGDVTNFTVTDKMPPVLWYRESLVLHNPWLTVWTPTVSWNEVSWRVTWTLEKWEYLEIQLTTYAKVMPDKDYDNVACVKYVDENWKETEKCDDEPLPAPDLWIKKYFLNADGSVTKEVKTVKVDDKLTYKITFGNSWTASATITSIKDFLPKNVDYISSAIYIVKWDRSHELSWSEVIDAKRRVDWVYVDIYGGITLSPKTEWYIILTGKVLSGYQDNTTNFACIYLNNNKVDCDDVAHKLTDEVICKLLDIKTKSFWKGWGTTNVTCSTDWWKAELIELNCGNGKIYTWSNVASISTWCTYPANSSTTTVATYSVECKVNGKSNSNCKWTVQVDKDKWWDGRDYQCEAPDITANWNYKRKVTCKSEDEWNYYIGIKCFDWDVMHKSSTKTSSFTYECDYSGKWYGSYNIQCFVPKYESANDVSDSDTLPNKCSKNYEVKCVENCGWTSWGCPDCGKHVEAIYTQPKCFNVNAWNVSIQTWEILPFYRNIEKIKSDDVDMDWFDETNYGYWKTSTYTNLQTESCSNYGQIALSSMICHFSITDWKGNEVESWSYPCLNEKNDNLNKPIVNAWIRWQQYTYHDSMDSYEPYKWTNYTFRSNVKTISNFGDSAQYLWEYKISLNQVDYLYCDAEYGKWRPWPAANSRCTSDFVLTNPYTVQKTPSGNLKASTAVLKDYLYMDGNSVMSNLLNAIATTEYEANSSVDKAMKDFIAKYEKLAVKVKSSEWKVIKKVPGKNIYFVQGNINLGWTNSDVTIDKPVTFVQMSWNTTIYGSVTNLNMMLLTEGTITFKDANNCVPNEPQKRQVVKWIFYAKWWLVRSPVKKNTNLNDYKRCSEWWLTIKWVIIWNGLQQMMKNSRSSLNDWFEAKEGTFEQKKKSVMNWASILIEYSPSVFTKSTMPPGAEDFTTALSIYKQ